MQQREKETKSLQDQFLEQMEGGIFSNRASEVQKLCFRLRFHPVNVGKSHPTLAKEMDELLNGGFSENSINPTISAVVKKVKNKFAEKMQADGVPVEVLEKGERGCPGKEKDQSPWEVVYKWLWEREFPRRGWQLGQEKAICAMQEIQMQPMKEIQMQPGDDRDMNVEIEDDCESVIYLGERYRLRVELQREGYLLLINVGVSGTKYGICPSRAFHPHGKLLPDAPLKLPCEGALVKALKYNTAGEEYFLAIVTEKPLELSWVRPDAKSDDLQINEERLQEVFLKLAQQGNSQVFYKRFEVRNI